MRLDVIKGKRLHQLAASPLGAEGKKQSNERSNRTKGELSEKGKAAGAAAHAPTLRVGLDGQSAEMGGAIVPDAVPGADDRDMGEAGLEDGFAGSGQVGTWMIPSPRPGRPEDEFDFT